MKRLLLHPVVVGLALTLAVSALAGLGRARDVKALSTVEVLERMLLDARFQARGRREPGPEIALVVIDDKTSREDQAIVERREGVARLVRSISRAGAKVIALDIFFFEPEAPIDPRLASDVVAYLERCKDQSCEPSESLSLLQRLAPELAGDATLASAIKEAGNVVLALHSGSRRVGGASRVEGLAKGRFGQTVMGDSPPRAASEVDASLPLLNAQAKALGFVTSSADETSTLREVSAAFAYDGAAYAALGTQAVASYLEVARARMVYDGAHRMLRLGDRSQPFDASGALFLNYHGVDPQAPAGAARSFPSYSAVDVVRGELPAGALEGRIVLVGYTYLGHDRVRTPFGDQFPGLEVSATLADNLLRGNPLRRAPWFWDVLSCLGLGLVLSLLFWPRLLGGALRQVLGSVAAFGLFLGATFWAFAKLNLWMAWAWPAVTFVVVLVGCVAASYAKEGLQRRVLRKAFSHYLADEVIRDLERRDEPVRLGGERRVLTAMFSDIRGFTTLSERLDPLQLVKFLNTHLSAMTEAVLAQGGLLDKYIGDALMAFFGAPMPHPDHADRALSAALAMHQALGALNAGPFKELGLTVKIGVGLNTGEMVVGNMGSERRVNYTIAGDAVNLASRLEGLTKAYGVFCLVGDATRKAASAAFVFRELDLVQVKGKTEAVAIHELVAGPGGALARYEDGEAFAQGLAAWRAGRFGEARRAFEAFAAKNPDDRVAPMYLERLAALGPSAPVGWSGVFVHTAK
ncbi:MAG: adenylate/guanylate cyclase domain-containing protein [Myxococcales bacterium]